MLELLAPLFSWLAADEARYRALGWTCFGLTGLLAFAPAVSTGPQTRVRRGPGHPLVFTAALLLTLLTLRWPSWFATRQPNPDEAHMIAGAITLRDYPVFWRDVDGTTHGPLDDYVLLLAPLLGLPLDAAGARFIGTLLHAGALLGAWAGAARFFHPVAARLAVLPGLLFWASTSFWDFFQYSSEMLPVCLSSLGGALGAVALTTTSSRVRPWALFGAGALLGLVPYAKLHGMLLAGGLGLILLGLTVRWAGTSSAEVTPRWKSGGWLVGGALAPTLLVAVHLTWFGLWPVFNRAYLASNLLYAGLKEHTLGHMIWDWPNFIANAPDYRSFFMGVMLAAAVLLVPALLAWRQSWATLALCATVALLGFLSVVLAGREYLHYLHFAVAPSVLLLAGPAHFARANLAALRRPLGWVPLLVLPVLALAAPAVSLRQAANPFVGRYPSHRTEWITPVPQRLRAEARPGDRLAIWGWQTTYYVETGLPQGTRDAQTSRMIEPTAMRAYYRKRFLQDLQRNRPAWFVDAVGGDNFAYKDRAATGHETFPELAAEIGRHYAFVADLDGSRIYRRK